MVEIQCPHCEEDVELEDGVFGLFDCPHCDEEFSWDNDDEDSEVEIFQTTDTTGKSPVEMVVKWGCYIAMALLALATVSVIIFMLMEPLLIFYVSIWIALAAGCVLLATIAIWVIGKYIPTLVRAQN